MKVDVSFILVLFFSLSLLAKGGGNFVKDEPYELIVCPASEGNPRNSEADVLPLKDGALLLAYTMFEGSGEDEGKAKIMGKISSDGGRHWSEPFLLQENIGNLNVMSASLLRLKNGRIALFFLKKDSLSNCYVYMKTSSDEGKTWNKPLPCYIEEPGYYILNNARVLQLSSGRIVVPVAYTKDVGKRYHFVSFCLYSDDEGRTWRRSRNVVDLDGMGADEPGVVELKDGRLLMIIRTNLGRIYRAFSNDGGGTWEPAEPTFLVSPSAPATIARIPKTGDLLIIWNNSADKRVPLTSAISKDEGESWINLKNLETGPGTYAYTSITFFNDRAILTYYEMLNGRISLKLKSLPISWFYDP